MYIIIFFYWNYHSNKRLVLSLSTDFSGAAPSAKNVKDWGIKFTVNGKQTKQLFKHRHIDLSGLTVAWALSLFNMTFGLVWPLRQESLDIDLDWTEWTFSLFYAVLSNLGTRSLIQLTPWLTLMVIFCTRNILYCRNQNDSIRREYARAMTIIYHKMIYVAVFPRNKNVL